MRRSRVIPKTRQMRATCSREGIQRPLSQSSTWSKVTLQSWAKSSRERAREARSTRMRPAMGPTMGSSASSGVRQPAISCSTDASKASARSSAAAGSGRAAPDS